MQSMTQKLFQNTKMMAPVQSLLSPVCIEIVKCYAGGMTPLGLANKFNMTDKDMFTLLNLLAEFTLNFYENMLVDSIPTKNAIPHQEITYIPGMQLGEYCDNDVPF